LGRSPRPLEGFRLDESRLSALLQEAADLPEDLLVSFRASWTF
jgi:hypothetical protein